jgi:hypothetical protein
MVRERFQAFKDVTQIHDGASRLTSSVTMTVRKAGFTHPVWHGEAKCGGEFSER